MIRWRIFIGTNSRSNNSSEILRFVIMSAGLSWRTRRIASSRVAVEGSKEVDLVFLVLFSLSNGSRDILACRLLNEIIALPLRLSSNTHWFSPFY